MALEDSPDIESSIRVKEELWKSIKEFGIHTGMVANSLNVPLIFLLYRRYEIWRCWVVTASKEEVLPDENSLPVTDLIEIIRLNNTTTPDSNLCVSACFLIFSHSQIGNIP
jgi:hypothetical protein